jgi:GNAT superfamily N-acetyltransferase
MVKAGLLAMPIRFGWSALKRLLEVKDWYDRKHIAVKEGAFPGCAHQAYSLQRMVVFPAHQGKGLGSSCLASHLKAIDESTITTRISDSSCSDKISTNTPPKPYVTPTILATQELQNVQFYTKAGFRVYLKEDFVGADGTVIPNWFMIRG